MVETENRPIAPERSIRVLVVDDSAVVREFLCAVLGTAPDMHVVGTECDGAAAVAAVARLQPDVVTMDIHMPRLDGIEATRRIMREHPVPIVIVSGTVGDEARTSFDALQAGALALLPRPEGFGGPGFETQAAELLETVRLMSGVGVVRRRDPHAASIVRAPRRAAQLDLIGIGASTGGPPAVAAVLAGLDQTVTAPVLLVQHMIPDFVKGFAAWLHDHVARPVSVAVHGTRLESGCVYVAPGDRHLRVTGHARLELDDGPPVDGNRPSATVLFQSMATHYHGSALGILLTGMGRDGASGLADLRRAGAVTVAQDEASSAVWGMPGAAVLAGDAQHVLPAPDIAALANRLASQGMPGSATARAGNGATATLPSPSGTRRPPGDRS